MLWTAQPFLQDIADCGEPWTFYLPYTAGDSDTKAGTAWQAISDTALVVAKSAPVSIEQFGILPNDSIVLKVNGAAIKPRLKLRAVPGRNSRVVWETPSITRTPGTSYDVLNHSHIVAIDRADHGSTSYNVGADCLLAPNSNAAYPFGADSIHWPGSTKPADGSIYGVTYIYRPIYEMIEQRAPVAQTGDDGAAFPILLAFRVWLPDVGNNPTS